jgi:hypothetical protein
MLFKHSFVATAIPDLGKVSSINQVLPAQTNVSAQTLCRSIFSTCAKWIFEPPMDIFPTYLLNCIFITGISIILNLFYMFGGKTNSLHIVGYFKGLWVIFFKCICVTTTIPNCRKTVSFIKALSIQTNVMAPPLYRPIFFCLHQTELRASKGLSVANFLKPLSSSLMLSTNKLECLFI